VTFFAMRYCQEGGQPIRIRSRDQPRGMKNECGKVNQARRKEWCRSGGLVHPLWTHPRCAIPTRSCDSLARFRLTQPINPAKRTGGGTPTNLLEKLARPTGLEPVFPS
jgi:hypothetical protein